jgi:RNA polymerase sigma factor (sigma-70 family)
MRLPPDEREARFEALFDQHREAVRAYLWRRDPELADDGTAETFLVAWRRLDDVPSDHPLPWLIGVARKVRLNQRRGNRRRDHLTHRLRFERTSSPDPAVAVGERDALWSALGRLDERDREVLLLTAWDRLDRDAVAVVIGCTRANVAVRLMRARRRLARELDRADSPAQRSTLLSHGGFTTDA